MNIEKNTALISIEEYDELREFKSQILNNNVLVFYGSWDDYRFSVKVKEEFETEIIEENRRLGVNNRGLKKTNEDLEYKNESLKIALAQTKSELEQAKKDTFWKWLTRK